MKLLFAVLTFLLLLPFMALGFMAHLVYSGLEVGWRGFIRFSVWMAY